jgi:hypothetical protein
LSQEGTRSKIKKILIPVTLVVIVCAFGIWQYYTRLPPSIGDSEGSSLPSDRAPNFSLKDVNGSKFTLSQFNGQTIIVHFMSVGCGGQIREITDHQLRQLSRVCEKDCGSNNFTIITVVVSTCEENTLELIRSFYNITWIIGNDYDDKKLEIVDAYEGYSIQDGSIVLIDKSFRVVEVYNEEIWADNLSTAIGRL